MSELINSDNIEELAKEHYIHVIFDETEFWEDFDRIKYIKRLFNRFRDSGEIKTNLVINHLIILFNVFDPKVITKILFFKFEGYHEILKPFLEVLHRCPDKITNFQPDRPVLYVTDIVDDEGIVEQLRQKVLADE